MNKRPLPDQRQLFRTSARVYYPGKGRETARFDSIEALAAWHACPLHPDAAPCTGEACGYFKAYPSHAADGQTIKAIVCKCAAPKEPAPQDAPHWRTLSKPEAQAVAEEWSEAKPMGYVAPQGKEYGPQAKKGGSHV
jgi:hypothetical protein